MRTMKILEFHTRVRKIIKNIEIYENHRIPEENHKNHEDPKIQIENHENHTKIITFNMRIMKIMNIIEFHEES